MTIKQIKSEMIKWEDIYGGKLAESEINEAKTIEELKDILDMHYTRLEDQLCDAHSNIKSFSQKLGFNKIFKRITR